MKFSTRILMCTRTHTTGSGLTPTLHDHVLQGPRLRKSQPLAQPYKDIYTHRSHSIINHTRTHTHPDQPRLVKGASGGHLNSPTHKLLTYLPPKALCVKWWFLSHIDYSIVKKEELIWSNKFLCLSDCTLMGVWNCNLPKGINKVLIKLNLLDWSLKKQDILAI